MGAIKNILFEEIDREQIVDDEYLYGKFVEKFVENPTEKRVWEYEKLQSQINESEIPEFFAQ